MQLKFSKRFKKSYSKLNKVQQKNADKTILLFIKDPFHKKLRNHGLKGRYEGVRSIDAGFDLRILFTQKEEGNKTIVVAVMVDVGTHAQLYG